MKEILMCPICKQELIFKDKTLKCINNHSFDLAKKGYCNLLLANQHHSDRSGDEKEMILSRKRFLNSKKYDLLKNAIYDTLKNLIIKFNINQPLILDLGCGEGYYTTYFHEKLKEEFDISTYGLDLSKQAINECSIRKNFLHLSDIFFVIGNMSYLPFLNEKADIILNCFSKIEINEFARTLKSKGIFIRILPGSNHLLEMKQILYKDVRLNLEKENEFNEFDLLEEKIYEGKINLNNQEINDLFTMTPYYYKSPKDTSNLLKNMESLETTIEFKFLIYQKK